MVNGQLDTVGNQNPPYSMVFSGLSNNCRIALRLALNISDVNHYIIFQYFIRSQSNQLPICGFQRIFFKGITLNILRHPACLPVWLFFRLCRIRFFHPRDLYANFLVITGIHNERNKSCHKRLSSESPSELTILLYSFMCIFSTMAQKSRPDGRLGVFGEGFTQWR